MQKKSGYASPAENHLNRLAQIIDAVHPAGSDLLIQILFLNGCYMANKKENEINNIDRAYRLASKFSEEIIRLEFEDVDTDTYRMETNYIDDLYLDCIRHLVNSKCADSYETDYGYTIVIFK